MGGECRMASVAIATQTFCPFIIIGHTNFDLLVNHIMFWPHQLWKPSSAHAYMVQDFQLLERVQWRATKLVKQIRHLPYKERLRKLGIPSIEERALWGDLIEACKILMGKLRVDPAQFLEMSHGERTRGHTLKLKKRRAVHLGRLKFFSHRVVTPWNKLPQDVVMARTFKNRLDKHWTKLF